jgi:hypothetical protein
MSLVVAKDHVMLRFVSGCIIHGQSYVGQKTTIPTALHLQLEAIKHL